jgi:hypothetical protein
MRPRLPAMTEDFGILTSGLFESVGQHRQALERSIVIDCDLLPDFLLFPPACGRQRVDQNTHKLRGRITKHLGHV